jgi:hypothetical protein
VPQNFLCTAWHPPIPPGKYVAGLVLMRLSTITARLAAFTGYTRAACPLRSSRYLACSESRRLHLRQRGRRTYEKTEDSRTVSSGFQRFPPHHRHHSREHGPSNRASFQRSVKQETGSCESTEAQALWNCYERCFLPCHALISPEREHRRVGGMSWFLQCTPRYFALFRCCPRNLCCEGCALMNWAQM